MERDGIKLIILGMKPPTSDSQRPVCPMVSDNGGFWSPCRYLQSLIKEEAGERGGAAHQMMLLFGRELPT